MNELKKGDILRLKDGCIARVPHAKDVANRDLIIEEVKISDAESIGEVVYFEDPKNIPYLTKYFNRIEDTKIDPNGDI